MLKGKEERVDNVSEGVSVKLKIWLSRLHDDDTYL